MEGGLPGPLVHSALPWRKAGVVGVEDMVVVKGLSVGKMVMIKVLVVLIVMVKNFLAEGIRGQLRIRTKMIIRNNTQLKK